MCSDTNPRPVCGGFLHGKCPEGHYCTNDNEGLFGSCVPFRFHFRKNYQNFLDPITSVSSNNVLNIASIWISLILFVLLCYSMKLVYEKYRSPTRKQVAASECKFPLSHQIYLLLKLRYFVGGLMIPSLQAVPSLNLQRKF